MGGARPRGLEPGKIPARLLEELLAGLPHPGQDVPLGPAVGEDAAAILPPPGPLVVATDPITLTGEEVARYAVLVNANDVAVTGARPRWFLAAVLLPPGTGEREVRELFGSLRENLAAVGAALIGGHTEVTPAVTRPIVVGQMLGPTGPRGPIRSGGLRPGEVVVQVGPVPVEGAAVLAAEAADRLEGLDAATLAAARRALDEPGISVVEPALLGADLGATAMHDPTEGGLAAGLHELAAAAGVRIRVDGDAVRWFGPGLAVCRALGADPWATLASGALLVGFPGSRVDAAVAGLARAGHEATVIGQAEEGEGVGLADGSPLPWPERDEVARVLEEDPVPGTDRR